MIGLPFRRVRGRIEGRFEPRQVSLLVDLFGSLHRVLDKAGASERQSEDPLERLFAEPAELSTAHDPVLARLFPDAYADPEASAEFRRLTAAELHAGKLAHLDTVLDQLKAGGRLTLTQPEAEGWLAALNDLRLTLGTRLGVNEDPIEEQMRRAGSEGELLTLQVYEWLGYLQECLVWCLDR
ncbi:MAG: DUF2017 domain-containing protein [Mycobacteriales bacterium]